MTLQEAADILSRDFSTEDLPANWVTRDDTERECAVFWMMLVRAARITAADDAAADDDAAAECWSWGSVRDCSQEARRIAERFV